MTEQNQVFNPLANQEDEEEKALVSSEEVSSSEPGQYEPGEPAPRSPFSEDADLTVQTLLEEAALVQKALDSITTKCQSLCKRESDRKHARESMLKLRSIAVQQPQEPVEGTPEPCAEPNTATPSPEALQPFQQELQGLVASVEALTTATSSLPRQFDDALKRSIKSTMSIATENIQRFQDETEQWHTTLYKEKARTFQLIKISAILTPLLTFAGWVYILSKH